MAAYNLDGNVTDQNGVPVAGALVYVYDYTGELASLTDSLGQDAVNPVLSDELGYWSAYVGSSGFYTLKYSWGGRMRYVEAGRPIGEEALAGGIILAARDAAADSAAQALINKTASEFAQAGAQAAENISLGAQAAAENARDAAIAAALGNDYYPGARSYVPRGMTSVAITAAGSGGTNGTYTCPLTGDNLTVDAYASVTVSGGAVTAVSVSAPGLYIGAAPTAGTVDTASITGLTGATLTPTIGYLRTSGQYYLTDHASDAKQAALFQNQGNAAVEVDASVDWLNFTSLQAIADAAAASAAALAAFTSTVTIGRAPAPITGTTITSAQAYVFNTPMAARSLFKTMRGYFNATGTIYVRACDLVGTLFVPVRGSERACVVSGTGLQTVSFPSSLVIKQGQYLQFVVGTASMLKSVTATADSGGYYSSTSAAFGLVANTYTLTTGTQLQIGFDGIAYGGDLRSATTTADLQVGGIALIGSDLADGNEATSGYWGTFVPASTGTSGIAYTDGQALSGVPTGAAISVSASGAGSYMRVSTSGEVLNIWTGISVRAGGNVFPASTFSGAANHPSWYLFYVPSSGGRVLFETGTGAGVRFTISGSETVGSTVSLTATSAKLAVKAWGTQDSILTRLTAIEEAASGTVLRTTMPVGYKPTLVTGWNHIIGYGQSNDAGTDSTPVISSTPSNRHKKLQFVRFTKPGLSGALSASAWDGSTVSALVADTQANLSATTQGETKAATMAIHAARRIGQVSSVPTFLASIAGKGGTDIAGLSANPGWLENLLYHITAGYTAATAAGVSYTVPCIVMDHGEADNAAGTSKATYYATAKTMMEAVQAHYQTTTSNTNKIIWLWSTATKEAANASQKSESGVAEAVLALCDDLDYCVYAGPAYRYPYLNASHHTAQGQALKGAYMARALAQLVAGYQPACIRWGSAVANGTALTVYASGPTALQFSGNIIGSTTQYGFALQDDTGTVTLSNIACGDAIVDASGRLVTPITMTLSRTLGTNPKLRYAKDYNPGSNPSAAGFGNLQDSTTETATLADASTHTLAHFAPPVTLAITAYE